MWTCKTSLHFAQEMITDCTMSYVYVTDLNPVQATSDWLSSLNNPYETGESLNNFNFINEIFPECEWGKSKNSHCWI